MLFNALIVNTVMYYNTFMKNSFLRREQLDPKLGQLRDLIPSRPKSGWIAEIRKALVMTTTQLAKRVGIDQSTLSRLERSEMHKTITLQTLERVADALNCEVRYVFIPRQPLTATWYKQAVKKLASEDRRLQHTLALERQSNYENQLRKDVESVVLGDKLGSKIWDDE